MIFHKVIKHVSTLCRTVLPELLQMRCVCPERCFAKRKAKPELPLFPAEGLESNFSPTVPESFDKSWLWN